MAGLQGNVQTDYSLFNVLAYAGQRYRTNWSDQVDDLPVGVGFTILPGQLVEVVANGNTPYVRPAQSASGALLPLGGFAIFRPNVAAPNTSNPVQDQYVAGDRCPFLRRGKIWALWSGTTKGTLVTAKYTHSSTGANPQGYVTDAATSATVGSEIDNMPQGFRVVNPQGGSTIVLVEVNFPAD